MTEAATVSVIVPTLGRPQSLERALRSLLAQTRLEGVEVVVADNDPAGSAEPVVRTLATGAAVPLRYVHAPALGVANARNAGVQAAVGERLAFLDDDESAPPDWLARLLTLQEVTGAEAVFGPVRAVLPPSVVRSRSFLTRFHSRLGPERSGITDRYHGCGNSLVLRSALPDPITPFCASRNAIGGEDDLLFQAMEAKGARFAWAADAPVQEHVPESKTTLAYVLRRAFTYGQGPASSCAAAGPRKWPLVPLWMAVGVAQALGYGLAALWYSVRRLDPVPMLDRTAQGLGKVLWFPPFKQAFYGRAARIETGRP